MESELQEMLENLHIHLRLHILFLSKRKLGPEKSSDFQGSQSLLVAEPRAGLQLLLLCHVFSSSPPSPPSSLIIISSGKGRGHKQADLFVLASTVFKKNNSISRLLGGACFLLFRWSLPPPSPYTWATEVLVLHGLKRHLG